MKFHHRRILASPPEVAATISPAGAQARHWHAVVVGAGPAGAATACRLAARGLEVLLLDSSPMPRPKLCGCCLSPAALQELHWLADLGGADRAPLPEGTVPLERVRLATPAVSAVVPLAGGGVISREALDAAGVQRAIRAGVAWLPATRVAAIRERAAAPGGVAVERAPGGRDAPIEADLAVVAAGLADTVRIEAPGQPAGAARPLVATASRLGLGATLPAGAGGPPPGELMMAVSRDGYCGVVRLEDGRVDLAAAVDRRAVAATGSAAAVVARILAATAGDRLAGLILNAPLDTVTFRGTPPLTRAQDVATPAGRILRVGDAAGYVEPFTGEGMGWALASARLCDEAFAAVWSTGGTNPGDFAAAAARYARLHAAHFSRHHARCRRVALAVRRPWVVGSVVRLARLAPAVAARVAPFVVGATSPRKAHG